MTVTSELNFARKISICWTLSHGYHNIPVFPSNTRSTVIDLGISTIDITDMTKLYTLMERTRTMARIN
jgi:hypothetical protein